MSAFTSGLIIVFNVWGGQKSGLLQNVAKEMANVQICLDVLKEGEKRHVLPQISNSWPYVYNIGGILLGVYSERVTTVLRCL